MPKNKFSVWFGKISLRTAQHWFKEFSKGRENTQDNYNARSGRPSKVTDVKIKDLILNDPHLTTRQISISLSLATNKNWTHGLRVN